MNQAIVSSRIQNMLAASGPVLSYVMDPRWAEARKDPLLCDFQLGNPHDMPLPGFVDALQKWSLPQDKNWFAYKISEENAREVVSKSLRLSHGLAFEAEDILMTTGAFAALSAVLATITDPGDEIIYISPPWFFYEMMIVAYGGKAVRVPCDRQTYDLDLVAIEQAITERTRGIIINSPNNPTGRIYPPETLQRLAEILTRASRRNGRSIFLLSDEAYRRIRYDGASYPSPAVYYPETFVIYTYGKTLLAPGQRLGYIALPPSIADRETLRFGLMAAMVAAGFTFPNALLQHAIEDIERLSIDIGRLQDKRDLLAGELTRMGYQLNLPEGTFYLLVRSPLENDMQFCERLLEEKILCLPGKVFEMPGYFRVSLTASEEMIARALPGFEKVLQASWQAHPAAAD